MNSEYVFPVIFDHNNRLALRHHVSVYSGYTVLTINRLIEDGKIAAHLIGFQIYIDVDEALTALSKSRFHPRRSASAASKVLTPDQKQNLFA